MHVIKNNIFRGIQEGRKFRAVVGMVQGTVERGDFFQAREQIPPTLTEEQDLLCRETILLEAALQEDLTTKDRQWEAMDTFWSWEDYVIFFGFL
jgi:hypothetical protein